MGFSNVMRPVGLFLQKPLQEGLNALSNDGNSLSDRIKKIAALILFPVWIVPAVALWFVGRVISWYVGSAPVLAPAGGPFAPPAFGGPLAAPPAPAPHRIAIVSGQYHVNPSLKVNFDPAILRLIPPPIPIPAGDGRRKSEKSLRPLIDKVDQNPKLDRAQKKLLKETFREIEQRYQNSDNLFYGELFTYLEKIAQAVKNGTVSEDQITRVFQDLEHSFHKCEPTWLETAETKYQEVYGEVQSPENKLLRAIQNYKEQLFIQLNQLQDKNSQWHGLNKFRRLYGKELGFNTRTMELDKYGNAFLNDPKGMKRRWLQAYKDTAQLITQVHMRITPEFYDPSYAVLLGRIGEDNGVEDPTSREYLSQFYDDVEIFQEVDEEVYVDGEVHHFKEKIRIGREQRINEKAVEIMLKHMGILI